MKLFAIVILLFLSFFHINDYSLYASLVLSCLLIKEIKDGEMSKLGKVDYCVILIWGYELLSLFVTVNFPASFQYFKLFTSSVLLYFVLRSFFQSRENIKLFLLIYCIFIGFASIISIYTFYLFEKRLVEIGLGEIYQFRYLYKPFGFYNNVWGSMQILFIGVCFLTSIYYRKNKIALAICFIILTMLLWSLVHTFSRGVYLALFVGLIWLCMYICVHRKRMSFFLLLGILIVLSMAVLSQKKAVFTVIEFDQKISQQRSVSGRIDVIKSTEKLFKMHPVLGGGSGNFSLLFNNFRYEDSNVEFTSYSPNIVVQLITEKGIVGVCLFFLLFCLLLFLFIRKIQNPVVYIVMGILIVYILREQTFSIFFKELSVQWTFFLFLAILQAFYCKERLSLKTNEKYVLSILIISLSIGMTFFSSIIFCDKSHNKVFLFAIKNRNIENAANELKETSQTTPYLINRALFEFSLYKDRHDYENLIRAKEYISKAVLLSPYDNQLKYYQAVIDSYMGRMKDSISSFEQIVASCPKNALYQFGYSKLLYSLGDKEKAAIHLYNSIELVPRILNTVEWSKYLLMDNAFASDILENLKNRIRQCEENDPIKLARYGSIAIYLEEIPLAKKYIEKSLELLPSLVYAWYNLSIIEKKQGNLEKAQLYKERFIVLAAGAFIPENIKRKYENISIEDLSKDILFLSAPYYTKYREWYKTEPFNYHVY